jgi:hypothetical protein
MVDLGQKKVDSYIRLFLCLVGKKENQEPRDKNQETRTKRQEPRDKNQETRTKNQEKEKREERREKREERRKERREKREEIKTSGFYFVTHLGNTIFSGESTLKKFIEPDTDKI